MATETLKDTKPPIQDDDHMKLEILENDASLGDAVAKSEDTNAIDKDGASDNHEVKEEDVAEEKKEEINKDIEEKDDVEDEEEEEEDKAKEKEKGKKSKKDPIMSAPSESPTKERKMVECFSMLVKESPSPTKFARSFASKGLIIEKVKFNFLLIFYFI